MEVVKCWRLLIGVAILFGTALVEAEEARPAETAKPVPPTLRVPKLAKVPVIDGKLDKEEWKGAAAVTGFANFGNRISLPQSLQPVWYMAYDDANFYLAFHYPVYPKGSLRAACKTKPLAEEQVSGMSILWDDHTEIEICTNGRENAVSGYFYKFMTNPWDIVADQKIRWSIGQMGWEYETGAVAKSVYTDSSWDQEIAIPLKGLGITQVKDGDSWIVQLVSAQDPGSNYFAWVPASFLQFHLFPEVILDSKAVAAQFLTVGDWMKGNPNLGFRLSNMTGKDAELEIAVKIAGSDGQTLLDQKKKVAVKAGESKEESIAATGLKLGELLVTGNNAKDNEVFLDVTDAQSKAVYYRNSMLLRKFESKDVRDYIKNLSDARKPAQPKLDYAYMPSLSRLRVSSDVGILGIDPRLGQQAKYLCAWFGKDAAVIGKNSTAFAEDGTGRLVFEFPPLAEGAYDITMEIQDASGKALVARKDTFERKIFPFESFKVGLEETVVKPYTPLKAEGRSFATIGNRVDITAAGLVAGIRNTLIPEEAGQNILAGPMKLVAVQDGKRIELGAAGRPFAWSPSDLPTKVGGTAESQLAGLTLKLSGEAEYTGQYLVNLDVAPNGKVALDRLDLEIPVSGPVDVAFAYDPRDGSLLYSKEHPWTGEPKEGELWNNLSERSTRPFVMFMGNGDRGIYWYTDSYQGYWIDRKKPHIFIEKRKDCTVLRVAIFNRPVVIDHPRHIRFATIAVPTKPLPQDARTMQWESERMAMGGASWWGTIGCFTFPLNDQEWQDWIAGKPFTYKGKTTVGTIPWVFYTKRGKDGRWILEKGKEYGTYRAADLIGYLQPEFKVFAGEWVDATDPQVNPDASLLSYKDDNKNTIWPEPEQRAVYGKDACMQSFYDFESYCFCLEAKNTGSGGHWWDWSSLVDGKSLDKGTMYLNDEGVAEPKMNLFLVRNFYHRVARIVQGLGIPDTNNTYAPGAVFQMPWITRLSAWESLYLESGLDDLFDAHGVDRYRMTIGKYSGIPVHVVMNIPINFKDHRARTVLALALLHDNGIRGVDGDKETMGTLKKAGLLDPAAKWIPYWRSQKTAAADKPAVLITAYKNDQALRLTLVVVNPGKEDVETDITVSGGIKAVDSETGAELPVSGGKIGKVAVKRHELRLISVEQ